MKLQRFGHQVAVAGSHTPTWRFPVPSRSKQNITYEVSNRGDEWFCTCKANKFNVECSHIKEVRDQFNREPDEFDITKPVTFNV